MSSAPATDYYPNAELYQPAPDRENANADIPFTRQGDQSGDFDIERARIGYARLHGSLELVGGYVFYNKTGPELGEGIWIGDDGFGIGNPAGHYIHYNFVTIEIVANIVGGTITGGTIAGFTIAATQLSVTGMVLSSSGKSIALGTADDIVILDADDATYRLWAGAAAAASAPFRVDKDGNVTMTAATVTGGTIAGFTIAATQLSVTDFVISSSTKAITMGAGAQVLVLDADDAVYRLWVGAAAAASAPFRVDRDGGVTITGALSLIAGSADDVLVIDHNDSVYRLWIGDATVADAPFRVTKDGLLEHEVGSADTTYATMRDGSAAAYVIQEARSSATESEWHTQALGTSSRLATIELIGANSDASTQAFLQVLKSGGTAGAYYIIQADGTHTWGIDAGTNAMTLARTNRALSLYGRFYPGSGSAVQTTTYLIADADELNVFCNDVQVARFDDTDRRLELYGRLYLGTGSGVGGNYLYDSGAAVGINGNVRLDNPTNDMTGIANWSTSAPAGAGYVSINIGGTIRRFPCFADA